jgi:hypothetical protein
VRAVLALALVACGASSPKTPTTTTTTPAGPTDYPPANFEPPTSGLAVAIAAHAVIDDVGNRILVRTGNGIDILALDSGKKLGRVDLGWAGELWPAGPYVLAMRVTNALAIEVTLVDPKASKVVATCSGPVAVPAGASLSAVDEFTTHTGVTYVKWQTTPTWTGRPSGAAVPDEPSTVPNDAVQAMFSCGLFAIHTTAAGCTLDVASYQDAGLDSCETRSMPWKRYLPSPIGKLALRIDRASEQKGGLYVDTDTLVVSELGGSDLWKLPIVTRSVEPPPP